MRRLGSLVALMTKFEYTLTDIHAPDAKRRGTVADLMLDAHIIPRCGLIPPFGVVAAVLRTGDSGGGMSPGCVWKPFELAEDDYWKAVAHLEQLTPDDLTSRHPDPHIIGEIQPDYSAPETDSYIAWLDSLIQRGHLPGPQHERHTR